MINLLIFGPPGSGKGTQSIKLAEKFNLVHLSTGDMLREEVAAGSDLGRKVDGIMKSGELVPDEVVIELIAKRIDSNTDASGFIYDGFPRTVEQAVALDSMLLDRNQSITSMLVLNVEHDELVKRLLERAEVSGRADDMDKDVIENRIDVYNSKTEPVSKHYNNKGKLEEVNGMGEIEDIFTRLSDLVTKIF